MTRLIQSLLVVFSAGLFFAIPALADHHNTPATIGLGGDVSASSTDMPMPGTPATAPAEAPRPTETLAAPEPTEAEASEAAKETPAAHGDEAHGGATAAAAAHGSDAHGSDADGSDAPHGDAAHGDDHGGHAGPPTELWLLIALGTLIVIAFRPVKQTIFEALDARTNRIKGELEEAKRLHDEARAMLASMQRQEREMSAQAEEIITHAYEEAERIRSRAAEDMSRAVQRREAQAVEKIAQAEAAAVAEVRALAVDVAMSATTQLLRDQLDAEKSGKLIDDAIEGLSGRLN